MERQGNFDYILLETTGLADPGKIAPLFWLDDGLGSSIYLDGVVTLVDAKNILRSLDDPTHRPGEPESEAGSGADSFSKLRQQESQEGASTQVTDHDGLHLTTAHLQISHADIIVINKSDLVTPAELENVKERIRAINGLAKFHVTTRSQVPTLEGTLLDLHAYDDVEGIDTFTDKGHSHLDPSISTITLTLPTLKPDMLERLDAWLRSICWESSLPRDGGEPTMGFEIHRLKGRIPIDDGRLMVIQGVREIFELTEVETKSAEPVTSSKIVVIGRGLDLRTWQESVDHAVLQ